jgi:uncharacterized repeat protein (TIGR03847 family)
MWDFGEAEVLEPEAIGEPGRRTFRLRILSGSDTASLWLEKEQLAALTVAIRQLLEQTDDDPGGVGKPPVADAAFPLEASVDFKIGRLGIGYDESQRMVVIFAYTMEDDENAPPSFSCRVSRTQSRDFAERAEEVVSSGRPLCILCGAPIEAIGHQCLRRNGHSNHPVSLREEDEDE